METAFSARISAGRGSFSVSLFSESPLCIKASVPAEAQAGRANRELVLGLEKLLGCSVRIVSGYTNRRKALAAACSREHLLGAIRKNKR